MVSVTAAVPTSAPAGQAAAVHPAPGDLYRGPAGGGAVLVQAIRAGAGVEAVCAAAGMEPAELYRRWSEWAAGQRLLHRFQVEAGRPQLGLGTLTTLDHPHLLPIATTATDLTNPACATDPTPPAGDH